MIFISAKKYFQLIYLVDFSGWLSFIHSVDFHVSQEILLVDLFGWLLCWLAAIHSGCLLYQPGNTFQVTYSVDFFGWLASIHSGWLIWLFGWLIRLTFWLTFFLIYWLTFHNTIWLTPISASGLWKKLSLVDLFGWLLIYILVDFHISQKILSGWLIRLTS